MSTILLDNDIVFKISRYSLVEEFMAVCATPNATYVLPTLKYVFRLESEDQALQRVGGKVPLQAMRTFLQEVEELHEQPSAEMLAYFQDIDQIDAGEAVLFAMTAMWDDSMTITGDKRALIALASLSQTVGLVDSLSGRLKCLEQIVAELMLAGFGDEVISKVQGQSWDRALRICFNSGDSDNALECLSSYYRDINGKCLGMLAPFPNPD